LHRRQLCTTAASAAAGARSQLALQPLDLLLELAQNDVLTFLFDLGGAR